MFAILSLFCMKRIASYSAKNVIVILLFLSTHFLSAFSLTTNIYIYTHGIPESGIWVVNLTAKLRKSVVLLVHDEIIMPTSHKNALYIVVHVCKYVFISM